MFLNELTGMFTIAYRDWMKLVKDRGRLVASLAFPIVFIGILGNSLQSNLGEAAGYNLLTFVFTGVLGQTLFQSCASGLISLIEDRENDFSQELFVAPISRYSIIFGKILGETAVALTQTSGVLLFGVLLGIPLTPIELLRMLPAALAACLLGGAFGVFVMSNLNSQRQASQIFPLVIFPQFFLAGVFGPIQNLPPLLYVLSRISPMTYAVDVVRHAYYAGTPDLAKTTIASLPVNLAAVVILYLLFFILGTLIFVRRESSR